MDDIYDDPRILRLKKEIEYTEQRLGELRDQLSTLHAYRWLRIYKPLEKRIVNGRLTPERG